MDKWEYRWVQANPTDDFELDKYGEEGWEAISCVASVMGGVTMMGSGGGVSSTLWVLMKRKRA